MNIKSIWSQIIKKVDQRGWHYEAKIDYKEYKKRTRKFEKLTKVEKKTIHNYYKHFNMQPTLMYYRLYKQMHHAVDCHYIPHDLYYKTIDCKFNYDLRSVFDDKAYYDLLFKDIKRPEVSCTASPELF